MPSSPEKASRSARHFLPCGVFFPAPPAQQPCSGQRRQHALIQRSNLLRQQGLVNRERDRWAAIPRPRSRVPACGPPVALTTAAEITVHSTGARMLFGFIGRISSANQLKDALDVSSQRTRVIADRVSKATLQGTDGFALPRDPSQPVVNPRTAPVNVEEEMTSLADEQLRFEATAKLLQKTYEQIRTSVRER